MYRVSQLSYSICQETHIDIALARTRGDGGSVRALHCALTVSCRHCACQKKVAVIQSPSCLCRVSVRFISRRPLSEVQLNYSQNIADFTN